LAGRSFSDKDEKIIELTEKNVELQRQVMDLEENLKAKDELVRVRTEAVALMSADLSARGKNTVDALEDTRAEMRKMQADFAEKEAAWREQRETMNVEMENKGKRLRHLEEEAERMESVRFDLATKLAAAQEKAVRLQEELTGEKRERKALEAQQRESQEEWAKQKLQLEGELKAATIERGERNASLLTELIEATGDNELAEKILTLENQVAELEEEKGQLQLRVVDMEDGPGNHEP